VLCARNFLRISFFPIFARFVFQVGHISFCRIYIRIEFVTPSMKCDVE